MSKTTEPVYSERGWITSEGNNAMITIAISKMNKWRDAASLATKPGAPPELPPELIEEALSQKKTLDKLLSETKDVLNQTNNGLNESQLLHISNTEKERNELEKTLRDKLPKQSKGKGPVKKTKSRRRRRRHRKSTRRRRRKY
jgi:hypothetical protein